jgi:hypothetical protein
LAGYGAQFFTQLFGEAGHPQGVSPAHLADIESKLGKLRPGHSRIAVRHAATTSSPAGQLERRALMATIGLAQRAGANVNLTWWHGPYFRRPSNPTEEGFLGKDFMQRFASVVEEARANGLDCVTHLTVQNEVNSHDIGKRRNPAVSMQLYNRLYRLLDEELRSRADPKNPGKTLRDSVDLVGGDLVRGGPHGIQGSDQKHWLKFMQEKMADVLDGYSIHVYWTNGDFEDRLEGRLQRLLDQVGEFGITKPLYVTEYGVRGADGTAKARLFDPGSLNGENIEDSPQAAFQHAWFNAFAPQHGIVGLAKWACYRVDGPKRRPERDWGLLCGAAKEFSQSPTYRVTLLFNRLTSPGWRAAGFGRGSDTLVSVFAGPAGEQSAVALNRGGDPVTIEIDSLKPNGSYFAAVWNRDGQGLISNLPRLAAAGTGLMKVNVPPSGLVALSTRNLGLA